MIAHTGSIPLGVPMGFSIEAPVIVDAHPWNRGWKIIISLAEPARPDIASPAAEFLFICARVLTLHARMQAAEMSFPTRAA
jgi:hypothetical protein